MADPLSHLAFAPAEEEEDLQDTFPSREPSQKDTSRPLSAASEPRGGQTDQNPLGQPSNDNFIETRMSYGDLLGQTPVGSPPQSHSQLSPEDTSSQMTAEAPRPERPKAAASRPHAVPATCPYQITVSEPHKQAEPSMFPGMNSGYMTYLVSTTASLPDFPRGGVSVRRRFRDFVALADLLKTTHRGYFVPPRPEKNPVEGQRAAPNFIEQRRTDMERFLQQLASHPAVSLSRELRAFLCADAPLGSSSEWMQLQPIQTSMLENVSRLPKQLLGQERSIPAPSEAAQSTKASGDLLRRFKEMKQSLTNELQEAPVLTDAEVALRNAKLAVEAFALRLATTSQKAERAVSRFEEAGGVLGDLGMALIRLAKFEGEQGVASATYSASAPDCRSLAADCQRTGKAAVRLSRLSRTAEGQLTTALEPLHDHLALAPAITQALREREASLLTLQALEDGREKTQRGISMADENSSDRKRAQKARALRDDLAALEAASEAAQGEYDKLTDRNQKELERWRSGGTQEYSAMLNALVRVNAAYSQRCQQTWSEVADEFGAS